MMSDKYNTMAGRTYMIEHDGNVYIGSTRQSLKTRLEWHKNKANRTECSDRPMYAYFNKIGWDNACITIICEYESIEDTELLWEERRLIDGHEGTCWNIRSPIQSSEERRDYVSAMNKMYRERDPEATKQRVREWYVNNSAHKLQRVQEWRHANRDRVNEQQRRRRMEKKIAEQLARPQSEGV